MAGLDCRSSTSTPCSWSPDLFSLAINWAFIIHNFGYTGASIFVCLQTTLKMLCSFRQLSTYLKVPPSAKLLSVRQHVNPFLRSRWDQWLCLAEERGTEQLGTMACICILRAVLHLFKTVAKNLVCCAPLWAFTLKPLLTCFISMLGQHRNPICLWSHLLPERNLCTKPSRYCGI